MLNYHHEPTNTSIDTDTGKVSGDTPWIQTQIRTKYVDTSTTRYDSDLVGVWTSQSIHLRANRDRPGQVHAYVETRDDDSRYLVVKLDQHDTIFVPIEIGEAIAGALAIDLMKGDTEAVAS